MKDNLKSHVHVSYCPLPTTRRIHGEVLTCACTMDKSRTVQNQNRKKQRAPLHTRSDLSYLEPSITEKRLHSPSVEAILKYLLPKCQSTPTASFCWRFGICPQNTLKKWQSPIGVPNVHTEEHCSHAMWNRGCNFWLPIHARAEVQFTLKQVWENEIVRKLMEVEHS